MQKRNYLLHYLRKNIKKRLQIIINILILQNYFAALTQRIKNS